MHIITHQQLKLISPFYIEHILNLELHVTPNEHATLHAQCIAKFEDYSLEKMKKKYEKSKIKVIHTEDNEEIFCGVLYDVFCTSENGYYQIDFQAYSGTLFLDIDKKSKSFQDTELSYSSLIESVFKETQGSFCLSNEEWSKPIDFPIIQYLETDWNFFKRLASHFNTAIIPEITSGEPKFWFGLPKGKQRGKITTPEYRVGRSKKFYDIGGLNLGFQQSDFLYYEISSDENFQIGDFVDFMEMELQVCEKHVYLKQGVLSFDYKLSKKGFISEHTSYNNKISGATIWGTVIETNQETLKIHLDIDKVQDKASAYPYEWAPETGNLFYMMPQLGTRVGLYFYNADERSAKAVCCVRTNGGKNNSTALMDNFEKRLLWTEHDKKMLLYPEQLTFLGVSQDPEKPLTLSLNDESGISFNTEHSINILAQGKIAFQAPFIHFGSKSGSFFSKLSYSASEIEAQTLPDFDSASSYMFAIDFEQQEYICASSKGTVYYAGQVFRACEKIDDAPKEGTFDWGGLALNVLAGLATVVVVTAAVAVCVAAGILTGGVALVAVVAVVGVVVVASACYDDFASGNVRSVGAIVLETALSMILAAVMGGLLPQTSLGAKLLSNPFFSNWSTLKTIGTAFGVGSIFCGAVQLWETGDIRPRSVTEAGTTAALKALAIQEFSKALTPTAEKLVNFMGRQIRANPALNEFVIQWNGRKVINSPSGELLYHDKFSAVASDGNTIMFQVRNPLTDKVLYGVVVDGKIYYNITDPTLSRLLGGGGGNTPSTGNVLGAYTGSGQIIPSVPRPVTYPVLGVRPQLPALTGGVGVGMLPGPKITTSMPTHPTPPQDPDAFVVQPPEYYEQFPEYRGGRSQDEWESLANDPSHKGKKQEANAKIERAVGLELERRGDLGHIVRDPKADKGSEFIDTTTGIKWDVKSFASKGGGKYGNKGKFDLNRAWENMIDEFNEGHNVIVNTTNMNQADIDALTAKIIAEGYEDRVIIFYP